MSAAGSRRGDPELRRRVAAELNERLGEVAYALEAAASARMALVRIALSSGSALALLALLSGRGANLAPRALEALLSVTAGIAGALLAGWFGREANHRAQRLRERWDALSKRIEAAL